MPQLYNWQVLESPFTVQYSIFKPLSASCQLQLWLFSWVSWVSDLGKDAQNEPRIRLQLGPKLRILYYFPSTNQDRTKELHCKMFGSSPA